MVIGHSVGGVLAVDYAARARSLRLPRAAGVMIIYPGGAIKDMPPVPEADPALIPAGVRQLVVLASPNDRLVGSGPAEAIATGAVELASARRRLITVDDEAAGDHFAPALDSTATRREFWDRADRLIRLVG